MAKKSLIIGIGSTGLSILEEAQQYHYEFTSSNKPGNNVEFIYLETDRSNKSRDTAGGKTQINPIFVDFGNDTNVDINQLKTDMASPAIAGIIARTRQAAEALQLTGTPALVIGDTVVRGAMDIDEFRRVITAERAKQG